MTLPPGPSYPAALQTLHYVARPEAFLQRCHRRYGDVFTVTTVIFGREVCVVRPEHIKLIFTGDPDELRAGEANEALEPVVGRKSVLLLDGAEHLRQRRLMLPPFHGERMVAYARTMREITERLVDELPVGRPFKLHPHMQRLTLEVILRTIFGVDEGSQLHPLRDALASFLDLTSSAVSMIGMTPPMRKDLWGLSPWAEFKRARAGVDELIYHVIARRRAEQGAGGPARDDILTMLLEARDERGEAMTDVELRDELMTLLAAGHETTATELCWAFDTLLRHPTVLARVRDEIDASRDASGAPMVERLTYLDAALKEVLRLSPVIPAVGRRVKRTTRFAGYDVPAGTLLVPGLWLTHRLPDIYPDPEAFRPERFVDKKPDPYAWLPFGGGIRRCLGMAFALYEMKIVLATVIDRVELHPTKAEPAPVTLRAFTHAPRGGVEVVVDSRRTSALRDERDESRRAARASAPPS